MKMNILLALLIVLVGCKNDVKPLWLSGSWKGTFKDTHTATDPKTHFVDQPAYPAELFYKVSTNSGTATYPTLGCTSNWVFLKTDNDTLFFEEKITSDKNNVGCVDKMQYQLLQLSKNEILIIGSGKTSSGSFIKTKGVLAKVDYASKKSNLPIQGDKSPQNSSNKTSNVNPDEISNNQSLQTVSNTVQSAQLAPNEKDNSARNKNSIIGSWLIKVVMKANRHITIYKVVYKSNNSLSYYKDYDFASSGYYLFTGNKLSDTDENGNIKKTYEITWTDNNHFSYFNGNNKYFCVRESSVTDVSKIRGSLIYSDNGELLTISEGGHEPPPPPPPGTCSACWGTCKEYCSTCGGRGKIKYQVRRERYNGSTDKVEVYYDDEYQNCSGGCENGQVPCPHCKCR